MSHAHALESLHDLEPTVAEFRVAVLQGLGSTPKTLPCKFFYDAEGSRLFDRICELPEYYPTRTECALLQAHAPEIAALVGPHAGLVEFGSGAGVKVRLLLAALRYPAAYVPVDISRGHLLAAAASLAADFPGLRVAPVCADYTNRFALPRLPGSQPRRLAGFFPGSTIGNFTPFEAAGFLRRTGQLLGRGSMMIVGVDLVKDAAVLEAAYDDASGVTAAFNLNLLARINRELDADFDLSAFTHEARWNAGDSRVEMHLVSRTAQSIRIGGDRVGFARGESVHTENSYKYTLGGFAELARSAGYDPVTSWTDPDDLFSIHALKAAP
jgi:dimethylhistidine N-methyltransferase